MPSILITGRNTTIAQEYQRWSIAYFNKMPKLFAETFYFHRFKSDTPALEGFPVYHDRYLFCHGLLIPKKEEELTEQEQHEIQFANYTSTVKAIGEILQVNDNARICVITSESGYRGSYNGLYAKMKGYLSDYVSRKQLRTANQQLVGISPGIIADAGMTTRRQDQDNVERRAQEHRMGYHISSAEVAAMAFALLHQFRYVSGTVIRMHGETDA